MLVHRPTWAYGLSGDARLDATSADQPPLVDGHVELLALAGTTE
jgi:hypothetical protein